MIEDKKVVEVEISEEGKARVILMATIANAAKHINKELPESHGFALFVFPFSKAESGEQKNLDFVSSAANRQDVIKMMKEFINQWDNKDADNEQRREQQNARN